jgi:hypothetical protein
VEAFAGIAEFGLRLARPNQLDHMVPRAQPVDEACNRDSDTVDFGRVGLGDDRYPQRLSRCRILIYLDRTVSVESHDLIVPEIDNRFMTADVAVNSTQAKAGLRFQPNGPFVAPI